MQDKKTLITIIVLLAIFLPATIAGTYRNMTRDEGGLVDDNPNHDLIYNGKVYFYYGTELLSTYDCANCTQTVTTIDDNNYHTNYYAYGTYQLPAVLNPSVALINQDGLDYVYSIDVGRPLNSFEAVKDYKIMHTEQVLIVRTSSGWGVVAVSNNTLVPVISYQYEYISLPAHIINGYLDTSKFIAYRNGAWYILNRSNSSDYRTFNVEVVDFNDNYYVTYENAYHIYDYTRQEQLSAVTKNAVYAAGDYILIIDNNSNLLVYRDCSEDALQTISLPSYESIYFNQTDAGVEIIIDGNLYQTIEEDSE